MKSRASHKDPHEVGDVNRIKFKLVWMYLSNAPSQLGESMFIFVIHESVYLT